MDVMKLREAAGVVRDETIQEENEKRVTTNRPDPANPNHNQTLQHADTTTSQHAKHANEPNNTSYIRNKAEAR
jgi:hypothetical protein